MIAPAVDWSDLPRLYLRDGRKVLEVLKTDVKDREYPVVTLVEAIALPGLPHDPASSEAVYFHSPCGAYSMPGRTHSYDVVMKD